MIETDKSHLPPAYNIRKTPCIASMYKGSLCDNDVYAKTKAISYRGASTAMSDIYWKNTKSIMELPWKIFLRMTFTCKLLEYRRTTSFQQYLLVT